MKREAKTARFERPARRAFYETLSIVLLVVCAAPAQQFDAAAIKLSPPRVPGTPVGTRGCVGGLGSKDPIRYICTNASISILVVTAYGVKGYQIRPPAEEDTVSMTSPPPCPPE